MSRGLASVTEKQALVLAARGWPSPELREQGNSSAAGTSPAVAQSPSVTMRPWEQVEAT